MTEPPCRRPQTFLFVYKPTIFSGVITRMIVQTSQMRAIVKWWKTITILTISSYRPDFIIGIKNSWGHHQLLNIHTKFVKIFTKYLQTWLYDWYQKFLVPPPIPGENRTKVNVSLSVTNVMDINEQVFEKHLLALLSFMPSCHLLGQAGIFQVQFNLKMSWLDSNLWYKVNPWREGISFFFIFPYVPWDKIYKIL